MLLQGPNLNFLGIREKNIYGKENYKNICDNMTEYAASRNVELECFQSNSEGEIIDAIQKCYMDRLIDKNQKKVCSV